MNKPSERNSQDNFQQELINRFFNPQSYFLYSFINELKNQESTLQHPSHVAIVGLLIDEIINAQDKVGLLEELSQINSFREFYSFLSGKIEFLCTTQLTTSQMMETIRALSSRMVKTLCHMIEDEEAYRKLTERIGLDLTTDSNEQVTKPEEIEAAALNEASEEFVELEQEFSEEQTEQPQKKQTDRDPRDFFYSDVHRKLKDIENLLKSNEEKWDLKAFRRLQDDFQDLRDWSMIQGDEGIETISHKILELLQLLLSQDVSKWNKVLPVIQESVTFIYNLDDSKREGDAIRALINQIEQAYENINSPVTGPEIATTEEVEQVSTTEELEGSAETESVSEEMEQSLEEERRKKVCCTEAEPDAESLILPGEDDQNLLEAIELWANDDSDSGTSEETGAELIDPKIFEDSPVDTQAFEKFIQELEVDPEAAPEFSPVQSDEPGLEAQDEDGPYGSDLIKEAEMYFTFAKAALAELKQDITNKRACEDIELACYSLKILANKLGYELIGKVAGAMEGIMKAILAGEIELKKSHVVMMADILTRIEEMGKNNRFKSAKLEDWVKKVLDGLFSIPKKDAPNSTTDFSFKQQQKEEDPLEFLMIDDHKTLS